MASKHLKNLISSLRMVNKYTKKYTIISYFMIEGYEEEIDSELFFIFILLTNSVDPTFLGEK